MKALGERKLYGMKKQEEKDEMESKMRERELSLLMYENEQEKWGIIEVFES